MRSLRASTFLTLLLPLAACGGNDDPPTGGSSLAAPANLQVTSSGNTATVRFGGVDGATSYTVERSQGAGGAFAALPGSVATTCWDDVGLQPSTSYRYRVTARNAAGQSAPSGEFRVTTSNDFTAGSKSTTIGCSVTASRTLFRDTVYTLSGFVKVQNGQTLTIQDGTKIVGDTLVNGSSLWILRGAKIDARGTATSPIVFTSARDTLQRKPGDWGGIIIIGNARLNRAGSSIFTEGPSGTSENYAGGTDDNDNSGTLRYVRIEFAGFDVSNGGGQELNTLSSYAVGRGTTYEYIQSMAGLDDSFEWWGGAVDGRYLVSFESGDDHFDWTEGYQGRNQFLIAMQTRVVPPRGTAGTVSGDPRGFEGDGCDPAVSGCDATVANARFSMPVFANFTLLGPGAGVFAAADGNGMHLRRGTGGTFVNGIVARWPGAGLAVRDAATDQLRQRDSLVVRNVVFAENGTNIEAAGTSTDRFAQNFDLGANSIVTMAAGGTASVLVAAPVGSSNPTTSIPVYASINLRAQGAAATAGAAAFSSTLNARMGSFFGGTLSGTAYAGAVDPAATSLWYQGWTTYRIR